MTDKAEDWMLPGPQLTDVDVTLRSSSRGVQREWTHDAGIHEPMVKRIFDFVLAGMGLLTSAPLWFAVALAIKIEDGGPVIFRQLRVGKGGRRFTSLKFRSMTSHDDDMLGALQARPDDPRVTRIGRFLRTTGLDELPQLWNILKGDMSFVGPRALLPAEIEVGGSRRLVPLESVPGYRVRQQIRPGLTGIAQVYAPRDLPRKGKFRYDAVYLRRRTFWLDVKLILASFWISARGRWDSGR